MLLLALSCLQGRTMGHALEQLLALEPDGVQLTPGNLPTRGFEEAVRGVPHRSHHGFTFRALRTRDVWAEDGRCLVDSDSVHPPAAMHPAAAGFLNQARLPVLETMYPGYALGTGAELERAMDAKLTLAVDVSHLHIQREQGVLGPSTLRRVLDYDRVAEVHVSANDGRRDQHRPLKPDAFGLEWARERARAGTPLILECYFHTLSDADRRRQIERVKA